MTAHRRLLLLSTSTVFGSGYLEYAEAEICSFLGDVSTVLFVPFALHDHDAYAAKVQVAFSRMGYALHPLHRAPNATQAIAEAEALFIGGGNTFRLLKALHDHDLLGAIRSRVAAGMPYMGSSAGSNVAAPTIRTTNDMPIVEPPSFEALGCVPFQINPHYVDPEPGSTHMGETRAERLLQFLEENKTPVLAMREGAMLRIEGSAGRLCGPAGARLFQREQEPLELPSGAVLDHLLATKA